MLIKLRILVFLQVTSLVGRIEMERREHMLDGGRWLILLLFRPPDCDQGSMRGVEGLRSSHPEHYIPHSKRPDGDTPLRLPRLPNSKC